MVINLFRRGRMPPVFGSAISFEAVFGTWLSSQIAGLRWLVSAARRSLVRHWDLKSARRNELRSSAMEGSMAAQDSGERVGRNRGDLVDAGDVFMGREGEPWTASAVSGVTVRACSRSWMGS